VLTAAVAALSLVSARGDAQSQLHPRWEIPGFDFRKDGAWRVKARQVSELRRQLLAQGRVAALNAPAMAGGPGLTPAVTGTIVVPALLFSYSTTDSALFMRDTAQYTSVLFSSSPPGGNPYTLRTFYEQMSTIGAGPALFSMTGRIMGWVRLDSAEVTYTGTPGTCSGNPFMTTNCNGLFSSNAINRMQNGFRQALVRVDTGVAGVNFGLFDNDGPDDVPNSGDDDGYVDMIMFAHATRDGACGGASNNHIWSHRFVLANATQTNFQDYVTNDARFGGGSIRISDYFATTALGGTTSCDTTRIMPIGTAAHEFGHALGLPDLYDTSQLTQGIGEWGLMGAGNFSRPYSPSRMEAWSLSELGWVLLRILNTTGTYAFGAAPVSDTAFYVRAQGTNTRGEYFLLENRQASQADTALIRKHCLASGDPPGCGGGLLIWHADSTQIANNGFHQNNRVNAGAIHGLKIEEADGLRELLCPAGGGCDRGDAGDLYPGTSGNTVFSFNTNPAATKNVDTSFIGFAVDSIRQVVPGGQMAFRLRFGGLTVVRGSDTNAVVQVDAANFNVFRNLFEEASAHSIGVADTQVAGNGRTRWRFASWSDAGARVHGITGTLAGATYTANLNRDFKLIATAGANGTISSNPSVNLAGEFIAQGSPIQLTATPNSGFAFDGWTGDTTFSGAVITLNMGRPYTVTGNFSSALVLSSGATRPNGVMGAAYDDTLRATGGTGTYSWSVTGGAPPPGVILSAAGVLSGYPRQTGAFSYTARVVSGTQSQSQTFNLSVTAPTLVTADVVTQLFQLGTPLNADQVRYLDYLGNSNTVFDLGDFLAWVKATGAPLSADVMARLAPQQKGGRP
jgi:M6 family metalloprotease-like protein